MKINNKFEILLNKKQYNDIISLIDENNNPSNEHLYYLGIAYYKLTEFNKAESIFNKLMNEGATSDIIAYLIICKIKIDDLVAAMQLYNTLCTNENKNIIEFIHNKDYENALNLTLFLKSIPLDLPNKESKTNDLIDLVNLHNYNKLSLLLAEKITT